MSEEQKIFNRHFFKLLLIFAIVIILTIAFTSFIEDTLESDKELNNSVQLIN